MSRRKLITALGPPQHRTCTCPKPLCFNDDEGRCQHCGHTTTPRKRASTRHLAQALAQTITKP